MQQFNVQKYSYCNQTLKTTSGWKYMTPPNSGSKAYHDFL
jgi:hypothetical protein